MHARLLWFVRQLAVSAALLAGCGGDDPAATSAPQGEDPASPPASVLADNGLITALAVTNEEGAVPDQYMPFFPIKVSVTIAPTSDDLVANQPVYVGLIEKVADPHATARTCLLGSIDATYGDGPARTPETFSKEFLISRDCLANGTTPQGVFNVWIGLNPGLSTEDGKHINPGDINTQFFNEEGVDTDGKDRNKQCVGPDQKPGCVIDIPIAAGLKKHDLRMTNVATSSSVAPQPSDCVPDFAAPLVDLSGDLLVYGADPHTGQVPAEKPFDAFDQVEAPDRTIPISYEICPRGEADGVAGCVSGTSYTALKIAGEAENDFLDSASTPRLVMGRPQRFQHRLYAPPGTEACGRLTGAKGAAESWLNYGQFNVKACAAAKVPGDEPKNNCVVVPVRVVRSAPEGTGQSSSLSLNKTYSASFGSSSNVKITETLETLNTLDLSGATSDSQKKLDLSGWFNKNLSRVYVDAGAYVALTGSGVDAGITALGYELYGFHKTVPEVHFAADKTYSKSACYTYGYTVAGLGLQLKACLTGSMGVKGSLDIAAQDGAQPPFDASTKVGSVVGQITPFAEISLDASASANLGAIKGGIDGHLALINVSLPITATLQWGLIDQDGIALLVRANARMDLVLSSLDGNIHAWVQTLEPAWCKCGSWCPGYPCDKWSTIYDDDIVDFTGLKSSSTLYKSANYDLTLQ